MTRPDFTKRTMILNSEAVRGTLLAAIHNLPIDADKPLQVTIEDWQPRRKLSQSALMFAGPLRDISEQAWIGGRQFSVEVLHEHCKREFLFEEFDPLLCKAGYCKWDYTPLGERVLIGSTTDLTVKGFSLYLEAVHAFGGSLGVMFHEHRQLNDRG